MRGIKALLEDRTRRISDLIPNAGEIFRAMEVRVEFLSDSVVVAALHPEAEDPLAFAAMAVDVCSRVAVLQREASLATVPLAYRGAIAFGEAVLDDRFLLGPAIDEAAACMELANAAMVWFAPSAAEQASIHGANIADHLATQYLVPLKDGSSYSTLVVNPFFGGQELKNVGSRILDTFDRKQLSVAVKHQNTDAFLAHCARHTRVENNPAK